MNAVDKNSEIKDDKVCDKMLETRPILVTNKQNQIYLFTKMVLLKR